MKRYAKLRHFSLMNFETLSHFNDENLALDWAAERTEQAFSYTFVGLSEFHSLNVFLDLVYGLVIAQIMRSEP